MILGQLRMGARQAKNAPLAMAYLFGEPSISYGIFLSVRWWYVSSVRRMVVHFSDKVMEYFLKWGDGVFLLRYGGGKHLWVVVYFFRLSGGIFLS